MIPDREGSVNSVAESPPPPRTAQIELPTAPPLEKAKKGPVTVRPTMELRQRGDYGMEQVSEAQASRALQRAATLLGAIRRPGSEVT
ncbi:MAG: hypothetical protein HW416_1475 [Chloroflexi bacterium]|nr:hypothetical protein [Chloroflexota bacterium]